MPTTVLTGTLIRSGSIPTTALGGGVVSGAAQITAALPSGTVSASAQVKSLLPGGTVTSSAQYPGWVTSSAQIDYNSIQNKLSGVVSSSTQVAPLLPNGTVSSSAQYPGWVTSSTQIDYNSIQNKLSGVVSSSAQVAPLLPNGTVSSSGQVTITSTTGYSTFSSSIATKNDTQDVSINALNAATSSYAINSTIQGQLAGVVSSSAQVKPLLPGGTVSSSAQYPGWVTSSAQIDYNSIQNKLSGVVSSSAQVAPLLPNGTVSSSAQYPGWVTSSTQIVWSSVNYNGGIVSSSAQVVAGVANQQIAPSAVSASGGLSGSFIQTSGNGIIGGNLTVNGLLTAVSTSIQYVTSSQINVADNKITVNTNDLLRFGGLSIVDSGSSSPTTASIYWDSLNHKFIYENLSGSAYSSAMFIAGPANTGTIGNEAGLSINRIPVAIADDHIDSRPASSSIRVDFPSRLTHVEAGLFVTGALTANGTVTLQDIPSSSAQIKILLPADTVTSSTQVKAFLPVGTVSSSAQYPGWVTSSSQIDYNSIQNKLSGVISSSTQFNALTGTSASFAATASFVNTLNQNVSASGNIAAAVNLVSNYSANDEGGEINLSRPQTNTSISGSVVIDVNQNRVRIFEANLPNRGGYFDITTLASGVGTNLAGGAGTVTSVTAGDGLTGGTITGAGTITVDTGSTHFNTGVTKNFGSLVSSSTQVKILLPDGTISSSAQFNTLTTPFTGSYTGSLQGALIVGPSASTAFQLVNAPIVFGGSSGRTTILRAVYGPFTNSYNASLDMVNSSPAFRINSSADISINAGGASTAVGFAFTSPNATIYAGTSNNLILRTTTAANNIIFRNTGETVDNLTVTNVGDVTITGSLLVKGASGITGSIAATNNVVSGAAQVATLLPTGTVSASVAGDAQGQIKVNGVNVNVTTLQVASSPTFAGLSVIGTPLLGGIPSSSAQIKPLLPDGTVTSSVAGDAQGQIKINGVNVNITTLQAASSPTFAGLTVVGTPLLGGIPSSSAQVKPLLPNGTVTSSAASSPSQGTVRISINGVDTDVDTGLQTGDSPTLTGLTVTGLTANQAVFTNGTDVLVSNAITGTGNVVMSASPTLTGTITADKAIMSGSQFAGIVSGSGTSYRLVIPVGTNYYAT